MIRDVKMINTGADVTIDVPQECPLCKRAIDPTILYTYAFKSLEGNLKAGVLYLCSGCRNTFVGQHIGRTIEYCEPNRFIRHKFNPKIIEISQSFEEIYNQALAAETSGLNEIAGMGYRKALEFLIKDYLINISADEDKKDEIRKNGLAACIKMIDDPRINKCALTCAWLGNDEVHYYRRHNADLTDLRRLLDVTVRWFEDLIDTDNSDALLKK